MNNEVCFGDYEVEPFRPAGYADGEGETLYTWVFPNGSEMQVWNSTPSILAINQSATAPRDVECINPRYYRFMDTLILIHRYYKYT